MPRAVSGKGQRKGLETRAVAGVAPQDTARGSPPTMPPGPFAPGNPQIGRRFRAFEAANDFHLPKRAGGAGRALRANVDIYFRSQNASIWRVLVANGGVKSQRRSIASIDF